MAAPCPSAQVAERLLDHVVLRLDAGGSGADGRDIRTDAQETVHECHVHAEPPDRLDIASCTPRAARIPMLTAYDYPTARIVDEAGIPLMLVGDSLGAGDAGLRVDRPRLDDEMLHHTKAVVRGTERALIVADMPFLTLRRSRRGGGERRPVHARGGCAGGQGRGRHPQRADDRGDRPQPASR